jgi:hypothetical protein
MAGFHNFSQLLAQPGGPLMRAINAAQNKTSKGKRNPAFQNGKNATAAKQAALGHGNRRNARKLPTRNMNRGGR